MVAHEHFMLRLPSLDADLAAMLLRMAATTLQDTVVFLLSDHGTHGIWYTEYEIGATEHQLPFLYVLAPDWLMRERPAWLAALTANQRRLVTVHELYRAMRALALSQALPVLTPVVGRAYASLCLVESAAEKSSQRKIRRCVYPIYSLVALFIAL